jgi:para-aminobenzoate synthetase/4-amino-4-deoxychorismate lyase
VRISLSPDPAKGVFETMLVLDGEPVELDAHLNRLAGSVAALYGGDLPGDAADRVRAGASGLSRGKLRITIAPAIEPRLEVQIATAPVAAAAIFPPYPGGVALRSVTVDGGLGRHKWADRRLIERAEAGLAPGELSLLVDRDGAALEASRASLFAVGDGWLATPPADGRILPGIARRRTIEAAREAGVEVREEPQPLQALEGREVFLVGSVRGIEPALALDGAALPPPGPLSARIAAGLRRHWLQAPPGESVAALAGGRRAGPPAR